MPPDKYIAHVPKYCPKQKTNLHLSFFPQMTRNMLILAQLSVDGATRSRVPDAATFTAPTSKV